MVLIASDPPTELKASVRGGFRLCVCVGVCLCVCGYAGECLVERNIADEVNQVSLELSHAALSLSGDQGQRA